MRFGWLPISALVVFLGACSAGVERNALLSDAPPPSCPAAQGVKERMLERINRLRRDARECGGENFGAAPPVTWNERLHRAALTHSQDMAEAGYFGHQGTDGLSVAGRVRDEGYPWSSVGENIASGQSSVDSVMEQWLDSPGHCANIMEPSFRNIGAACVTGPGEDALTYWTLVLAAPK
ncbi:MAG: CAP domain-containing protein [Ectothiorhodospiraceae bacterium]|jgi:uncharacterized protein YkwD